MIWEMVVQESLLHLSFKQHQFRKAQLDIVRCTDNPNNSEIVKAERP